jgi:iron complex transport system substrate-binding protein
VIKYWISILALLGGFLVGCTQSVIPVQTQQNLIQVTTSDGVGLQLAQPAQRIVCLFEASVDDLYMLGAGQRLIAIPAKLYTSAELYRAYSILDSRIAAQQLATPSNWEASTNIESVVALSPDLVIVSAGQKDLIQLLRQMSIAVYPVQSENLAQTQQELLALGQLTGTQPRAEQLLGFIQQEIAQMQMQLQTVRHRPRVYYAWSGGRIFSSSGQDSMPNTIIQLAGADNVVQSRLDQPNVNPETLISWDPEVILLWNSDPKLIEQRAELRQLHAVRQHQVFSLSPSFLFNPHTPKILLAANQLHHWIYPQQPAHSAEQDKLRILSMYYGATKAKQLMQLGH